MDVISFFLKLCAFVFSLDDVVRGFDWLSVNICSKREKVCGEAAKVFCTSSGLSLIRFKFGGFFLKRAPSVFTKVASLLELYFDTKVYHWSDGFSLIPGAMYV